MSDSRAARLMKNADGVDKIVIMNGGEPFLDSTFWYITGASTGVFEGSLAIVSSDGTVDMVVGSLEEEAARTTRCNVHVYRSREEHDSVIKELLGDANRIGINSPSATYSMVSYLQKLKDIEVVNVSEAIERAVSVKDDI